MVRTIIYIDGFNLFLTARQFTRRQDGQLRRNEEPSIKGQLPFAAQIKIIEITVADTVLAPVATNGLEPVCKLLTQRQNVRPLVSAETGQVAIVQAGQ